MKKIIGVYLSLVIFLIFVFADGIFAVPMYINYQGLLSDGGEAVDGTRNMLFGMFRAEEGGANMLGRDIRLDEIPVINGIFNARIGPFSDDDLLQMNQNDEIWLEVTVEMTAGDEKITFPRQRLSSAAFALRAESAATAEFAERAESAATVDDNAVNSGKIEDGTVQADDLHPDALAAGNINNMKLSPGGRLDFGRGGAYIREESENCIDFYTSGMKQMSINESGALNLSGDLFLAPDKKIHLNDGEGTYVKACEDGSIDFRNNGIESLKMSKTIYAEKNKETIMDALNNYHTALYIVHVWRLADGPNQRSYLLLVNSGYYGVFVNPFCAIGTGSTSNISAQFGAKDPYYVTVTTNDNAGVTFTKLSVTLQ